MSPATPQSMDRSVRFYPIFALCTSAHFWLPVFFLYFIRHMSLADVLRLEAVYYAAVVILEVPSGYFSDAIGRRITLIIAAASTAIAHTLFLWGDTFLIFSFAQVALAAGAAFRSGTDTSFHYDLLRALNREAEYDDREAAVARNAFIGAAIAALLGGFAAAYALHLAYALSLGVAFTAFIISLSFTEPPGEKASVSKFSVLSQTTNCLRYLRNPGLAWLMGFAIFITVINHIPYEFYQPYIRLLGLQTDVSTPILTGLHTALTMIIAAYIARRSIRLRDRMGTGPTLLIAAGLQTALITLMAIFLHPIIALLLGLRSSPRALMAAPLNAAVVPRLQKIHRATYLSIQSLFGRLSFSAALMILSASAGADPTWPALSHTLSLCTGFALVGFLILTCTTRLLKNSSKTRAQSPVNA